MEGPYLFQVTRVSVKQKEEEKIQFGKELWLEDGK